MTTAGRRVIDAIERTPLALPMAGVTAAAAAFLAYAAPATIVERGLVLTGVAPLIAAATPFGAGARAGLMLAAALVAGAAIWWLFHRLEHPAPPAETVEIDLFAPEPVASPAPLLRRADAHPDAPARRPLFAASDLGTPLDDVDAAKPFGRAPLFDPAPATAEPVPADDPGVLLLDQPYTGPENEEPEDESIAGLMARLERGLSRRGGCDGAAGPNVADDGLRQALDELRRMTAGR